MRYVSEWLSFVAWCLEQTAVALEDVADRVAP